MRTSSRALIPADMSTYFATILWQRNGAAFTDQRYSRAHVMQFDGGAEVATR